MPGLSHFWRYEAVFTVRRLNSSTHPKRVYYDGPQVPAEWNALMLKQLPLFAALSVLVFAQASSAEVFICGDSQRTVHSAPKANEPHITPTTRLLRCQCKDLDPRNHHINKFDLPEAWQCMGEAAQACQDEADPTMCYGEVLSYLEKRTLIDVEPVSFFEFAARINFAIAHDIERQQKMRGAHFNRAPHHEEQTGKQTSSER